MNSPDSNYGGVILTTAISGNNQEGVLVSTRLAICNGVIYTSTYTKGSTYGVWVKSTALTDDALSKHVAVSIKLQNTSTNVVYGCYRTGIYFISGTESGLPLSNYSGFMIVANNGLNIVKVLFLMNTYCYTMSQSSSDGSVVVGWTQFSPN